MVFLINTDHLQYKHSITTPKSALPKKKNPQVYLIVKTSIPQPSKHSSSISQP
jgi:hypothetical protein